MKRMLSSCLLFCISLPSLPIMSETSFSDVLRLSYEQPTQRISYGKDKSQFAEYWHPGSEKPAMVILIHGGCWLNTYKLDHIRALASHLKSLDYAVWSIEYRRVGDAGGGWPGSFTDIIDAVNSVRDLDVDLNNVFVMGHSAGGHLALWVGGATHFEKDSPFHGRLRLKIKGVIGLAAISNLMDYAGGSSSCERATPRLMGGKPERHPKRYQHASPHLLPGVVNTILIHGDADTIVKLSQSQRFTKIHDNIEMITASGLGHFDLINPNTDAFKQVIRALERLAFPSPSHPSSGHVES